MYEQEIEMLLEESNDLHAIATGIYKGHDDNLAIYLIQSGLEQHRTRQRSQTRRNIKQDILKPEVFIEPVKHLPPVEGFAEPAIYLTPVEGFVEPEKRATPEFNYNPQPSQRTRSRAMARVRESLLNWPIGNTTLGNSTKSEILAEAKNERARGKGHIDNAFFYEKVALPMNEFEKASDRWTSEEAIILIRQEALKEAEETLGPIKKIEGDGARPTV